MQPPALAETEREIFRHVYQKKDGRTLSLYSWTPAQPTPQPESGEAQEAGHSHRRWHPLRNEWVTYSAARQNRTFQPPAEYCPLCPTRDGAFETEIPFDSFDIAVFDNKFPAYRPDAAAAPHSSLFETASGAGKCEVVVYSAAHQGSVADLPPERLELLVRVWNDRYAALRGQGEIKFVMPFENRGAEAGVTLPHPHGQIYAFSYLPPLIEQAVKSFRQGKVITDFLNSGKADPYIVCTDGLISAFVPPFARYPFEVWIAAHRSVPGPWAFDNAEIASFARTMQRIVRAYDRMFEQIAPYLYVMHAAPVGEDAAFEFSAQFYPLLRAPGRLKYLGGCEQGSGAFLNDVLPEDAAERLRQVL